jgi:PKD repeat protein
MKNLLFLLAAIVLFGLSSVQAQQVSISGTITDSGTGFGVANYPVEIVVYDSLTTNLVFTMMAQTDSAGGYNFTFPTSNGPFLGNGEVNVSDCNGTFHSLHFVFNNGSATLTNFDFWLCIPSPSCNAAFMAISQNGSTQVVFNDFSTTNIGNITNWDWQFGDGATGSGLNLVYNYAAVGTYYACLTITTSLGCTATFCDSVHVGSSNGNCQVALNYGILPSGAYGFTALANGTGQPLSYHYDFGDGNTLSTSLDTLAYSYPNANSYLACVTVQFTDSCLASACVSIVTPNLLCNASFASMPDTTGQYTMLLVNNSTGNGLSYSWDFGDGGSSNSAYPTHTYAGPGTYMVCLTVWDSTNTCASTFCDSITVINKVGAAFTIQVVPGILTASPSAEAIFSDLRLFPNPANEKVELEIQLQRAAIVHCEILDLSGRRIAVQSIGFQPSGLQRLTFDVQDIAAGLYLMRVNAGATSTIQKLIVGH